MSENFLTAKINITLISAVSIYTKQNYFWKTDTSGVFTAAAHSDYKERRKNDRAHAQNYIRSYKIISFAGSCKLEDPTC